MRVLRFVGPGEDASHVTVETVEGDEQFSLVIGEQLKAAAGTDLPRLSTSATPSASALSPREIQVRARAGESAESIAESSDMQLDRVLRFAGPVLAERARITVEARRARARQSTPEGQLVSFGDSVDARYSAHGIDPSSVRWDACRREDGVWIVSAAWHGGDAERIARWALALQHRIVTPLDETAADLLSDRPLRPIVHAVPDHPEAEEFPTDALPSSEQLFDQDESGTAHRPSYENTPLPLRLADPIPPRGGHGRPKVPGWDEILLGVRRNSDT
jgi:hypothetical protein